MCTPLREHREACGGLLGPCTHTINILSWAKIVNTKFWFVYSTPADGDWERVNPRRAYGRSVGEPSAPSTPVRRLRACGVSGGRGRDGDSRWLRRQRLFFW